MPSPELKRFFSDLRGELNKEARPRPERGELLRRAFEIPLVWPPAEFPDDRDPLDQMKRALSNWGGNLHVVANESELMAKVAEIAAAAAADPNHPSAEIKVPAPKETPKEPPPQRREEIEFDTGDSKEEELPPAEAAPAVRAGEPAEEAAEAPAELETPRPRLSRWRCERLDRFDWEAGLRDLNPEWFNPTAEDLTAAAQDPKTRLDLIHRVEHAHIGITDCDFAVAQTGTLCFLHDPARHGFLNLLPWTHIAVVTADQVLRTLQDLGDRLAEMNRQSPLPPNTIFITGPSRSGDIDIRYGRGAAGPGNVHVIVLTS